MRHDCGVVFIMVFAVVRACDSLMVPRPTEDKAGMKSTDLSDDIIPLIQLKRGDLRISVVMVVVSTFQ
jgi:hypothetical protein